MEKELTKRRIAARVAEEIHDGDVINLGIGIPTLIPGFLPPEMEVTFHSENGIIGLGPRPVPENAEPGYIVDAGGKPAAAARGGSYIDSCTSFGLIRGGHVDCTVLGALQVDEKGNLSNWIIPGKMIPGMGGAMDLVVGARKVIIAMEHTVKGTPRILKTCTLPYTAINCVDLIITEMGVIRVTPKGLRLVEYASDYTIGEIQSVTDAQLDIGEAVQRQYGG
jgi:acetate CoA/acetoacetate CoA-transferase beta subunit